jgi:PKD repeat protein
MPLGREKVKLQWQVAPLGMPFTATAAISGTSAGWTDVLTTGVVITQNVAGLTPLTPYHWRARLLYRPGNRLGQPAGRWLTIPWNGWTEQDFRTPLEACDPVSGTSFTWTPITPTVGESVTFTGSAFGTPSFTYTWDLGDGTTASGPIVTHTYTAAGDYQVTLTVTNPCGQQAVTRTLTVVEGCNPVYGAGLAWTPITPTVGETVTFTGSAFGTPPFTYTWDFSDGDSASGNPITHTYAVSGSYMVTLTVTNACGSVQVVRPVTVVPVTPVLWRIYLPIMTREF